MVDDNLIRLAGTGNFRHYTGRKIQKNGLIKRIVLPKKQNYVVYNPGHDELCKPCGLYKKCFYKFAVYSTINHKDKALGVIGISALDEDMATKIKSNLASYLDFIEKMGQMISTKLTEKEILDKITLVSKQLDAIINSIDKGVIAVDHKGLITHINNFALTRLGNVPAGTLIGVPLIKIIPELHDIEDKIKAGKFIDCQEFDLKWKNKSYKILCSLNPIEMNSSFLGAVCSFEDFQSVKKIAYTITDKSNSITFDDIIGESKVMCEFKNLAKKVAPSQSNILIIGETGTGKDLVARAIHYESQRKNGPFITINCGAMPESLIESELFGYEKGSFTGASKIGKPGKFALADGGTIFLDEIGTMPLYLQPKLLRVIENREIERIGSSEKIYVDIRIISATNEMLDEMVKRGEFRQDLFHRLNVVPLFIPPLREREGDILVLADHFIRKYSHQLNKDIVGLSKETEEIFMNYKWPGNVRELENAIEYGVNLEEGRYISPENIPFQIKKAFKSKSNNIPTMDELERQAIVKALRKTGWSNADKEEAAKNLNISRATLYRKIKKYNISEDEIK